MPSACGLACEVCGIREKVGCAPDGCVPGNDPKASGKLEKFKTANGRPCYVLECAIKNKVDYCTRCDEFPCEVHYQDGPYRKEVLDMIKGALGKN